MNDRVRRVHCSNGFYEFDSHTTTKYINMNKVKLYLIKKLLSSLYLKNFNKEQHSFSKLEELIQDDIHVLLLEEINNKYE